MEFENTGPTHFLSAQENKVAYRTLCASTMQTQVYTYILQHVLYISYHTYYIYIYINNEKRDNLLKTENGMWRLVMGALVSSEDEAEDVYMEQPGI